jgi:Gdp/GTP exchange factor required for growth at low temperatures
VWVGAAMNKSWSRIPVWEARIFNDLKKWTSSTENFKYIRATIDAMTDPEPLRGSTQSPSVLSGGTGDGPSSRNRNGGDGKTLVPKAGIPFIGEWIVCFL